MNAELHKFKTEEVMACLDGEIAGERALALADHLQQCRECSGLAYYLSALSQQLIAWKIESSPLVESPSNQGMEALTAEEAMGAFKSEGRTIAALPPAQERAPAIGPKSSLLSSFLDFIRRPRVEPPWERAFDGACVVILILSSLSHKMAKVAPSQSATTIASDQRQNRADIAPIRG